MPRDSGRGQGPQEGQGHLLGRDRQARLRGRAAARLFFQVMLMGAVRGVFTAIERMGQTNGGHGGRIINVASAAGITVDTYIT